MLNLFEKIAIGFGVFCGLLTLGLYFNAFSIVGIPSGVPRTQPTEFLSRVRDLPAPNRASTRSEGPAASNVLAENKELVEKLRLQGLKVSERTIERKRSQVPPDLFEAISVEANWIPELKKIHATYIHVGTTTTRVQLDRIAENSLLRNIGFEAGDVVNLIDGKIVEFSVGNRQEYYNLAREVMERLRDGGTASVTVTRGNRPVHIEFQL